MGKRQLGELQPTEFVITFLISNIAALPIENPELPLINSIVPIFLLVALEVLISYLLMKSAHFGKLLSGSPRIVIRDGKIDQQELKSLRFTIEDLTEKLRAQGYFDLRDISFAIVETTGNLSVYPTFAARQVTAGMLQIPSDGTEFPQTLIISDGILNEQALKKCGKDLNWLNKKLRDSKLKLDEVFIMTCDRNDDFFIIKREEEK